MGTHPLEVALFIAAGLAVLTTGFMFTVKLSDLVQIKRTGTNGPILFMKWDNIRHQGFMLAVSSGLLALSIAALNNHVPPSGQALNFISGGIAFATLLVADSLFRYRRRRRLAELVAEYERRAFVEPVPGGKRRYDPPLPPSLE